MNNTPGIAGFIDFGNTLDTKTLLRQMLEEMKHETFHVIDLYSDPPIGIGRVHLGVDNFYRQPIFSKDQKKCIVLIGKVHSYRNLPHSLNPAASENYNDSNIILHLYSEYGLEFVDFLNGSFLFAIWDSETKKLVIVNDRYGFFPMYYSSLDNLFLFASEVKSILKLKSFPRILDERSIADFFSFGYILGNKTLLKDAKLLPPACICIVDTCKNDIAMKRYWDFDFVENKHARLENIAKTINSLLKSSVSKRIPKKKLFGLALSGGFDSRAILAAVKTNSPGQVFAFTLGMKEGSDPHIAEMVCNELQIPHHFCELKAENLHKFARKAVSLTDGMLMFQHSYGLYPVYQELKKHFDMVFVGMGGDLFHGGFLGKDVLNVTSDSELTDILFRKTNSLVPYDEQGKFFSPACRHVIKYSFHDLREEIAKIDDMSMANKTDYFFLRNRMRRFINLGLVLFRIFFEVRTPFYDYDLIDLFQTVPPRFRLNNCLLRQVFSTYYPELGNIPVAHALGFHNIPMARHLVSSPLEFKIGSYLSGAWTMFGRTLQSISSARLKFINPHPIADINYWFRTELRDFIESILLDSKTLARPYFNHKYIAQLIRAHVTGQKNLADLLGALVTFELWHRMFFDQ